jgi:hypothetical protein
MQPSGSGFPLPRSRSQPDKAIVGQSASPPTSQPHPRHRQQSRCTASYPKPRLTPRRIKPRLGACSTFVPSNKSRSTAYRAAHTASARPSYENRPSSQLAVADMLRTMRPPSVSPQCGDDSALTCDASRRLALLPESAPQCCMSRTTIVVAVALALAAEFPAKSLARPVRQELGFLVSFP